MKFTLTAKNSAGSWVIAQFASMDEYDEFMESTRIPQGTTLILSRETI